MATPIPTSRMPQSGSLYVGDLRPDVTEALLFEIFNQVGPVSSIRVCRDAATRRSLGYAYVNFHSIHDAERALDTLNFQVIKGAPCRIMWSHRDPSIRKSALGNIFVKNLATTVDHKMLYDSFSSFGNILSCKVATVFNATSQENVSKGYGFVHFETESAADSAIAKMNNTELYGQVLFVGKFLQRSARLEKFSSADSSNETDFPFTNIFIKNIPSTWTPAQCFEFFSHFGKITSQHFPVNEDGKCKGYGCINFQSPAEAKEAIKSSRLLQDDKAIEASRYKSKNERAKLREKEEKENHFTNVYFRNVPSNWTQVQIRDHFSKFGDIKGLVLTPTTSRGFGYVAFSDQNQAKEAAKDFVIDGTTLYAVPYLKKGDRYGKSDLPFTNIYVKNVPSTWTQDSFRKYFLKFGKVASVFFPTQEDGNHKGYGFVNYETWEDAKKAAEQAHLEADEQGNVVYAIRYLSRGERKWYQENYLHRTNTSENNIPFTNIYVKSISPDCSEQNFLDHFCRFGKVKTHYFPKAEDGKSKGFAYVNYNTWEEAKAAISLAQQTPIVSEKSSFVVSASRYKSRRERGFEKENKKKEAKKLPMNTEGPKLITNLYVKNLEEDVDDEKLRSFFAPYGAISSAIVMRDEHTKVSKGFGFVNFIRPEDATKALTEMNGKMVNQKPIYVNKAQRKDERRAQLANYFNNQMVNQRVPIAAPFYYPQMPQMYFPQQQPPRPKYQPRPMYPAASYPPQRSVAAPRNPARPQQQHPSKGPYNRQQVHHPAARRDPQPIIPAKTQELTATMLASAPPEMQKQILGERLFPLVQKEQPELAGKITGMLLEMEVTEILGLLDSQKDLQAKVLEALAVLQSHTSQQ